MNSEKRWIGRWIGVNYRMDFLLLDTVTERERERRERKKRERLVALLRSLLWGRAATYHEKDQQPVSL